MVAWVLCTCTTMHKRAHTHHAQTCTHPRAHTYTHTHTYMPTSMYTFLAHAHTYRQHTMSLQKKNYHIYLTIRQASCTDSHINSSRKMYSYKHETHSVISWYTYTDAKILPKKVATRFY